MIKRVQRKIKELKEWNSRTKDVLECPDNRFISRSKNAGTLANNLQFMHNGLKVKKGGYYGTGITKMLVKNKGVHEPQEERVFQEVLKHLSPKSVMVELGSYWSFYSMWFLKENTDGKTYLFEPDHNNLEVGKFNYEINGFNGDFNNAYIGDALKLDTPVPTLTIDHIISNKGIHFIDILHCDIQGFEVEMLKGSIESIKKDKIGYFFISTHSNNIHQFCLDFLTFNNYIIVCEADLSNSYSVDGIIVAKSPNYEGINKFEIARK